MSPSPLPGDDVEGLPDDVSYAYTEARRVAGVRAYTSCELICRKILMHVAVNKGAEPGKSFAQYLTYLGEAGYITLPMKHWVDLIRRHGNIATHEIPPSDERRALETLIFTAQMLRLIYEMEHKAKQFTDEAAAPTTP